MPLPPASAYPWPEPLRTGLLTREELHEGEAGDLGGRTPVAAVGSNASPTILRQKLGALLASGLPLVRAEVEQLAVGHSAHVSARGYIAAAPFRSSGSRPVTVAWFDPAQLAAMDATEPNYHRIPLPGGMPCHQGGERLTGVEVYESTHGVIGERGTPLTLLDQASLLAWLAQRLPGQLTDSLHHDALAAAGCREQVRTAFITAGVVLPSGL